MAMKETERSLRWFFLITGGLTVIMALGSIGDLSKLSHAPTRLIAPLWFSTISHLVLGAGFVLAGMKLKAALLTGARWIQRLVLLAGVSLVVELAWTYSVFHEFAAASDRDAEFTGTAIGVVIRLAVVAYLYASVRRLSGEAQVRTASTTFE